MGPHIAVVGAGIMGLSTAVQLQDAIPNVSVTIIADKFERDTVSDGAAGSFRPTMDYVPGLKRERLKKWSQDSFAFYSKLAHSVEARDAGVGIISGYQLFSEGQREKDPLHREVVFHFRELKPNELRIFPGTQNMTSGFFYTTLIVESRWYLPWLMRRFNSNGGKVEKRTLTSLEELSAKYDVVVNCAGGRSMELVHDTLLKPIRGQMMRVKAPWIKHFLYVDHNCWIIPGKETVTVGGTRQENNTNPEIDPQDSKDVLDRACTYMPSLRTADIAWEWVGPRPCRTPVRLEKDILRFGTRSLKVVHNYGHGGNGISLSWGCGVEAVQLVNELLGSTHARL